MGYAKQTVIKTTYRRTRTKTRKNSNTSNKSKRCPKCGRYI